MIPFERHILVCTNRRDPQNPSVMIELGAAMVAMNGDNVLHGFRTSLINDTRDSAFLATQGHYFEIGGEMVIGTFDYPRADIDFRQYWMLHERPDHSGRHVLSYSTTFGVTGKNTPVYENFFAGGSADIRGFRDNTLGPADFSAGFRQPLGGAFKTVATAELIFPTPFMKEGSNTTRLSWFVDVGNVFKDYNAWDASELRASTGLSFQWRAPVGPIVISISKPLRKQDGDDTESIQFSFGPQF